MQPLNSSSRLVCEDLDEIGSRLVTGGLQRVIVELFYTVLNLVVDLCAGQGTVDAGSGLGGVSTEETYIVRGTGQRISCGEWDSGSEQMLTLLVEDDNITTSQVDCVRGTQTGHCEIVSVVQIAEATAI